MALIDPANQLMGTAMGPLPGVAPQNPLVADAMAAPQMIPPPAGPPAPPMPSRENLTEGIASNNAIAQLLAKLLAEPALSSKSVIDALATAVGGGHTTAQQAASEIAKLPQEPRALRALIQERFLQNMQMGRRMNEMMAALQQQQQTPEV